MSWRANKGIKRWAADDWFSKCIRQAHPICEICQRRESTDCAHIYGRASFSTRWCKDNCLALCRHCHDHTGQHPLVLSEWLEAKHPGRKDRLMVKQRGILKNNAFNRKLISEHYRGEYRRMVAEGTTEFESWN